MSRAIGLPIATLSIVPASVQASSFKKPDFDCQLKVAGFKYRCSIGYGGIKAKKKEGDGATPAGTFPIRKILYRSDRVNSNEIKTHFPLVPLKKNDAWCDDSELAEYNTQVSLPFKGRYEKLWRDDFLYDIIVIIGYNDGPVVKNKDSTIFLHIARIGYTPTLGYIGLAKKDLLQMLPYLKPCDQIKIRPSDQLSIVTRPLLCDLFKSNLKR